MKLMGIVNMPKFCEYNGVGENQFIPAFCFLKDGLSCFLTPIHIEAHIAIKSLIPPS